MLELSTLLANITINHCKEHIHNKRKFKGWGNNNYHFFGSGFIHGYVVNVIFRYLPTYVVYC